MQRYEYIHLFVELCIRLIYYWDIHFKPKTMLFRFSTGFYEFFFFFPFMSFKKCVVS